MVSDGAVASTAALATAGADGATGTGDAAGDEGVAVELVVVVAAGRSQALASAAIAPRESQSLALTMRMWTSMRWFRDSGVSLDRDWSRSPHTEEARIFLEIERHAVT